MTTSDELINSLDIFKELELFAQGDGDVSMDPQAVYRELLNQRPVHTGDVETEYLGVAATPISAFRGPRFSVLGYAESMEVLNRGEIFSNSILELLQGDNIGRTILTMDDPEHRIHRLLVRSAFTRKAMGRWSTEFVEPLVDRMIDQLEPAGAMEFVAEFSRLLPVAVIQEIIGLEADQLPELSRLAAGQMLAVTHPEVATACAARIGELLASHLEARRTDPQDDVVSILVNERLPTGEALSDDEILSFLRLLLPAGAETTTRLMSSMMLRVLTEPGILERLRDDPSLIPKAITEAQRLHPPFQWAYRLCGQDTTVGDVPVPAGAAISVSLAAANRDPRRFENPEAFDLDRAGSNLAFGLGMHICLGVHLARMEAEVAFGKLLQRLPRLRLDLDKPLSLTTGVAMASPAAVYISWD